jgi:flagellar biosynthesis protein FliR
VLTQQEGVFVVMQKLINAMAVASFAMSTGMVVGTVVLYSRIPSLTKLYLSEIKLELTEMVHQMLPVQIEKAVPELPTQTGLPIKLP